MYVYSLYYYGINIHYTASPFLLTTSVVTDPPDSVLDISTSITFTCVVDEYINQTESVEYKWSVQFINLYCSSTMIAAKYMNLSIQWTQYMS